MFVFKYVPDSYVVCGPEYNRIRSLLHDSFFTGKLDDLNKNNVNICI